MGFIANLGMQAAGNAVDAGFGMILGNYNDRRQLRQQQALTAQQMAAQKEMLDYAKEKDFEMWQRTNYKAQMAEMEKAGLNPGLIYGMKGGGGVTTGGGAPSVQGGTAPQGGGEIQALMGMGMQRTKLMMEANLNKAQVENIKADTANKNADTAKKSGVDTQEAQTRIQKLLQETKTEAERTTLTKVQADIADLDKTIKSSTLQDTIKQIEWTASKTMRELQILDDQQYISHATRLTQVEAIRQDLANKVFEKVLMESNVQKNDAEIRKMAQDIIASVATVDQNERRLQLETKIKELQAQFPGISQAMGRILNDAIESIFKITNIERTKHY